MDNKQYILVSCLLLALPFGRPASAEQQQAPTPNPAPPPPGLGAPERLTQSNPCTSRATCEACVQTASCAWCLAPDYGAAGPRCFQPSYTATRDACPEEYVFNPDNVLSVLVNRALSRAGGGGGGGAAAAGGGAFGGGASASWGSEFEQTEWSSSQQGGGGGGGRIVQVAPQRVNLKLRAGQTYSVYMRYSQAEDYPVDLYYLMDLSRSMYDDKEKLSQLGDLLAQTMRNITSDFTLGFGSFVDKVVMPYVSTVPSNLLHPCEDCAAPYGYHHIMRLSTDTSRFSAMVKQAPVSGNLDAPEGGFDAMLQAAVCGREIGWREQARRLLVVSTDASSHFAGDGKLGGIVKPNDGLCHLDHVGRYTQSTSQDYPSVEQLNVAVKGNAINVIFAVTEDTLNVYQKLAGRIEGASAAKLAADSSNVVELIRKQYEQISSTVRLRHNASADVSVRFASSCLDGAGAALRPTDNCAGLRVGDEVSFRIDVEVLKCPKDPKDRYQTIQVYPVGINESMTIDLEMLCACECEKPGDKYYEAFSPRCNGHGTYRCGICECAPGAFGRRCECSGDNVAIGAGANITAGCIPTGGGPECSGRGQCVCGRCDCDARPNDEHIYGTHCECDNFSCDRHEGKLCSGPDHGVCDCGRCRCKDGWTGASCACQVSNASCYAPGAPLDGPACSDHGECECGQCKCRSGPEGRYSGRYCEKCPTCLDKCQELRHCVECQMYGTGPVTNCSANCTQVPTPIEVEEVNVEDDDTKQKCTFYDDDGCRYSFAYYYDAEGHLNIIAEKEKKCPPVVYTPHVVLGVIAAIVLLGMAVLLLWKFLTTIHDRREFARFEKERMMAKWDTGENPIYKQATSTFKNPTYAGKG